MKKFISNLYGVQATVLVVGFVVFYFVFGLSKNIEVSSFFTIVIAIVIAIVTTIVFVSDSVSTNAIVSTIASAFTIIFVSVSASASPNPSIIAIAIAIIFLVTSALAYRTTEEKALSSLKELELFFGKLFLRAIIPAIAYWLTMEALAIK